MPDLVDLDAIEPLRIWDGVRGRPVEGERITMGVIELDANAHVPEHRHPNEQLGILLRGSMRFRIGDEERELLPGGTWRILADVPHEVHVGPEGAVCIDVFSPPRDDWRALPVAEERPIVWPAGPRNDV
jgi:quercetin dioxygenase-like cupin family protein